MFGADLDCVTFIAVQVGGTEAKMSPQRHAISMVSDSSTAHVRAFTLQLPFSTSFKHQHMPLSAGASMTELSCAAGDSCPEDAPCQLLRLL